MPDSPIFLIGPPKTGTTLLSRLLDQHPDVCVQHEDYIAAGCTDERSVLHEGGGRARMHGFAPADCERWRSMDVEDVLNESMADFKKRCGAKVCINSWPFWYNHLDLLQKMGARYINTLRHPCAVFFSSETSGMLGSTQEKHSSGGGMGGMMELIRQDEAMHCMLNQDSDVMNVRYETLIKHPRTCVDGVNKWIGVDPDKYRGIDYLPEDDPYPRRWDWIKNSTHGMDMTRADRWFRDMNPSLRYIVGNRTKGYRDNYGYTERPYA